MWQDPIVEEVHAIREQLLAQFDGDVRKYCAYVQSHPIPTFASAATAQVVLAPLAQPAPTAVAPSTSTQAR